MSEIKLNILDPEAIALLRGILNEVVLALPKRQRSCEVQLPWPNNFSSSQRREKRIPSGSERAHSRPFAIFRWLHAS